MGIHRELEQVISNAMFGKATEDLDLGQASKFVKRSEEIIPALQKYVEGKLQPKFLFKMLYYYKDVTGYYYDTGDRTPISIKANSKEEAEQILLKTVPKTNGRSDFKLHCTIKEIEQL